MSQLKFVLIGPRGGRVKLNWDNVLKSASFFFWWRPLASFVLFENFTWTFQQRCEAVFSFYGKKYTGRCPGCLSWGPNCLPKDRAWEDTRQDQEKKVKHRLGWINTKMMILFSEETLDLLAQRHSATFFCLSQWWQYPSLVTS